MHIHLTPSQDEIYQKIAETEDKYYRRRNRILFGKQQIGKTELMKQIAKQHTKYHYVNFTKEHLKQFLSDKRLGSIHYSDLQEFLRHTYLDQDFSKRIIILDEIDSILSVIAGEDSYEKLILCRQLLAMDQRNQYLFVVSQGDDELIQKLRDEFIDRVLILPFTNIDKQFIIRQYFNNVNLFDLGNVTNLRQMLDKLD